MVSYSRKEIFIKEGAQRAETLEQIDLRAAADLLTDVVAEWADFSAEGNGQVKISGAELAEYYQRVKDGFNAIQGPFQPAQALFRQRRCIKERHTRVKRAIGS